MRWYTVNELCELYSFSRSTFYRMLKNQDSGLARIVIRLPPPCGRIRVPGDEFHAWLTGEAWESQTDPLV